MRISKDLFDEIYKDTPVAEYRDLFYCNFVSDQDMVDNYIISKLWRLNNLYTIVDKQGQLIRFEMNLAQHKVYADSLRHPRLIILKSRQQGISTFWLIYFFDEVLFKSHFSTGLMAQGKAEGKTLLERTNILWDNLDPEIKDLLGVTKTKENTEEYSFNTQSTIFIRTSFRSTTLQGLHISEFGKIANANPGRAKETKTGTLQAIAPGNVVAIESTAEGSNAFKDMWDKAVMFMNELTAKDFKPVFLSWVDDPDCVSPRDEIETPEAKKYFKELLKEHDIELTQEQRNFWIMQKRELGPDMSQEYPATPEEAFLATRDGTYYAKQYLHSVRKRERELKDLYDKNLPVKAVYDLGMNDDMVCALTQEYTDGIRFIGEYRNSGEDIDHYCEWMRGLPFEVDEVILPSDALVTDLTSGETREEAFERNGYDVTVLDKCVSIAEDRQIVRSMLRTMVYIDPERCPYLIDCFLNYTKEWDDKRQVWKDKHDHNEHSHGADAIRYACISYDGVIIETSYERQRDHDV